jgi:hypothetical protein
MIGSCVWKDDNHVEVEGMRKKERQQQQQQKKKKKEE